MFLLKTIKQVIGTKVVMSQSMVDKIEAWNRMYKGEADWTGDQIQSLRLEQGICREFANVCLNEMQTSISNVRLDTVYQQVIKDLNENLQSGLGLGSFCIKPLGKNTFEYVTADKFVPVEFDTRGRPIKMVFITVKQEGESSYYLRFEYHALDKNGLTITNQAFHTSDLGSVGAPVSLTKIPEWSGLAERVSYPLMDRIDFGYYRNPIKNKIDGSFCGVSVFDCAAELIKKADTQFGRIDWEFESGERAVHVDPTALRASESVGADGKRRLEMPRLNHRLFKAVNIQPKEGEDLYKEFSPVLRDENFINGLNAYLRRIEFNTCLSYGDLSDVSDVDKTATEARIAKKRKYNMVKAIQNNLKDCLEDLVYGLAFYNGLTKSGYEMACTFKDSILVDEETERQQDRADVSMGVMSRAEYRAKWYGETEEEAAKKLPQQAGVIE